jgi:hypothetical protein
MGMPVCFTVCFRPLVYQLVIMGLIPALATSILVERTVVLINIFELRTELYISRELGDVRLADGDFAAARPTLAPEDFI